MEEERSQPNRGATVALVIGLVLVALFVGRIVQMYFQIQNGEVSSAPAYQQRLTTSQLIASAVRSRPAEAVTVETADDPSLGRADAPVTVVEFADFGCPFSAEEYGIVRSLAARYPEKVRFIYRDMPLVDIHPQAAIAAEAGECAQDQGKFWEYHDLLFANQDDLSAERLVELARAADLNLESFATCLDSGRHADEVAEDLQDAIDAGVEGTPTFFINGVKVPGAIPSDIFEQLILDLSATPV